jgi:hypothetical protein
MKVAMDPVALAKECDLAPPPRHGSESGWSRQRYPYALRDNTAAEFGGLPDIDRFVSDSDAPVGAEEHCQAGEIGKNE